MPNLPKNKFKTTTSNKMENRINSRLNYPEYHTTTWRAIRAAQLSEQPFCKHCGEKGKHELASVCDHITPVYVYFQNGKDFWEASVKTNLQSLCESCHNSKSGKEKRG